MKLCKGCMEHYDNNLHICPYCGYEENTPPESPFYLMPGILLAERYIIGKVLGCGGFGITYIAYDCHLQMKVAIKEYLPTEFATRTFGKNEVTVFGGNKREQFMDGLEKFVEEAKRIAKFNSDWGIVHIYDTIRYFNTAYLIMEYLDGETLSSLLKREKKISVDRAIEILTPVINSLRVVHKEGIIHRDIAPDNIIITKTGDIKLIDFGAARYATATHSRSLTVMIKPGYSPEEQYRSRGDQGPHTDVYSLGATLYRMITGQTPPNALERRAYFENKGKDILPPIRKYVRDINVNVETAILNALNVRIEDRTKDTETFIAELKSTEPVKRRVGKIKKIDPLTWPLWAKITFPTAAVGLIVFIVLMATGVILPDKIVIEDFVIPEGQTRVPSVISQTVPEGEERLAKKNLLMEIGGKEVSDEIQENYILTQEIDGGSIVPINTRIKVTISTHELQQIVPNEEGMEAEEAEEQLEERDFSVTQKEEYSDVIAEGCVISQSEDAYTQINDESEITIVISEGRNPDEEFKEAEVEMPDFVGMTYDETLEEAKKKNLTVKVTAREYNKDYDRDVVISQTPKAKSKVKNTQVVELVVSLGYDKVIVPDVQYRTEDKAKSQIVGRGLKYHITYENSDTVLEGLVMSQSPEAKTEVDPESTVELVVSLGKEAFTIPDVVGKQEDEAQNMLNEKGLSVNVDYKHSDSKIEGEVLEQSVEAGSKAKSGDEITITIATKSEVSTVPNVFNKTQKEAEKLIKDKGFKVSIVEEENDTVEKGKVFLQNPPSGRKLKKSDTVSIFINSGSEDFDNTTQSQSSSTSSTTYSSNAASNMSENIVFSDTDKSYNTSISFSDSLLISVGETKAVVTGDFKSITSSDTSIVVTNSDGTVTGINVGTAYVTIEYIIGLENRSDICRVTVISNGGYYVEPSPAQVYENSANEEPVTENQQDKLYSAFKSSTNNQNELYFIYDDYDGDGNYEAFGITGDSSGDNSTNVKIYFISTDGTVENVNNSYDLYGSVSYGISNTGGILSAGNSKFIVWEKNAGGPGGASYIYGVKNGSCYEPGISGNYQGFNISDDGGFVGYTTSFGNGRSYTEHYFSYNNSNGEFIENN